jgi:hypothetical protein
MRWPTARLLSAALLTAAVAAPPGFAQDAPDDPWMTDRYEVDVIVFRHLDQSRNTPESPPPPLPATALQPGLTAPGGGPDAAPPAETRAAKSFVEFHLLKQGPEFPDFVVVDDAGGELRSVYARLERFDAYEPILRRKWLQAARPAEVARPFPIAASARDFELSGSITLYKERYLHLNVDLRLAPVTAGAPAPAAGATQWPVFSDALAPPDPAQAPLRAPAAPTLELQESRRIRGINAQYFDHPRFGVIALISKVDLDVDEAEPGAAISD